VARTGAASGAHCLGSPKQRAFSPRKTPVAVVAAFWLTGVHPLRDLIVGEGFNRHGDRADGYCLAKSFRCSVREVISRSIR
jgi:hypothetical protein